MWSLVGVVRDGKQHHSYRILRTRLKQPDTSQMTVVLSNIHEHVFEEIIIHYTQRFY